MWNNLGSSCGHGLFTIDSSSHSEAALEDLCAAETDVDDHEMDCS